MLRGGIEMAEPPATPLTGHPSTPRLTAMRLADWSLRHGGVHIEITSRGGDPMNYRASIGWGNPPTLVRVKKKRGGGPSGGGSLRLRGGVTKGGPRMGQVSPICLPATLL